MNPGTRRGRWHPGWPALLACVALAAALTPLRASEVRVALVIGNAAYPGAPLANPVNDARGVASALADKGFEVIELRDATKPQIEEGIRAVQRALEGKEGVGMLYYAGHGMQLDWRNYLLPVDAKPGSAADVRTQAIDVQQVLDAFRGAGTRINIVVLDACRDNPFGGTASGKGLAQMDAPPGTLLAYATAPGNVADDGDGKGGLYTQHLVRQMRQPQARIEDVFKRVRFDVRRQSQGRQIPWESTSLEDDFSFDSGIKAQVRPSVDEAQQAYDSQRADWQRIASSDKVDDYYEYLKRYPSGSYSELAQARVERLQNPKVSMQPDRDGRSADELRWTPKDGDTYQFVNRDGYTGETRSTDTVRVRADSLGFDYVSARSPTVRFSREGLVMADARGSFDPPWVALPGGALQVGNKASGRTTLSRRDGTKLWLDYETRIVARERLTTALGTLDTFRVDVKFLQQDGARATWTFWHEPGWGYPVRLRLEFRAVGTPDLTVRELVGRSRRE